MALFARPLWDADDSDFEVTGERAIVSRARFRYLMLRPTPPQDARGLDPVQAEGEEEEAEARLAVDHRRRRRLILAAT